MVREGFSRERASEQNLQAEMELEDLGKRKQLYKRP